MREKKDAARDPITGDDCRRAGSAKLSDRRGEIAETRRRGFLLLPLFSACVLRAVLQPAFGVLRCSVKGLFYKYFDWVLRFVGLFISFSIDKFVGASI